MTRFGRALFGAALGAVLTLSLHPASRPYLFSVFIWPAPASPPPQQDIPNDLVELSDWMSAVGDQYVTRKRLTPVELNNAIAAANHGVKLDPDNAFWHQMLAYFYHQLGNEAEAKKQWFAASACATWNDYQSTELLRDRERLAKDFGAHQSWQLAYAYFQRSENAVLLISAYSRAILAEAPLTTKEGLLLRSANVINGAKLRWGSRSIHVGNFGAEITEVACHPPQVKESLNHHRLFLARMDMHNRLRDIGQADLAEQVNRVYREADAWDALLSADEASDETTERSYLSLLYVGLPTMLLVVGLVGALLGALGLLLGRLGKITLTPSLVAGLALGVGVYAVTFLPLAGIATALCCACLTLGPKRERRLKVNDLGPMFGFTICTLGTVFMLLLGAFVIGFSAPAESVLPALNVPREYFGGSGVLLGLAIIVLALLLLLAPLFATALRLGTSLVLGAAFKKFGAFLAYTSLAAIVLATPACIYLDRQNSDTLQRIVSNEPVYYFSQQR
ncbi:MAG TPA: hypothetical protein VHE55_18220 [Fimbriimonadaceae bacterium]|nr:hypothetical protein [Fimbriimonadaceae bacterium]